MLEKEVLKKCLEETVPDQWVLDRELDGLQVTAVDIPCLVMQTPFPATGAGGDSVIPIRGFLEGSPRRFLTAQESGEIVGLERDKMIYLNK